MARLVEFAKANSCEPIWVNAAHVVKVREWDTAKDGGDAFSNPLRGWRPTQGTPCAVIVLAHTDREAVDEWPSDVARALSEAGETRRELRP